ncbi:MAG: SIS domain-containing protein [Magnetococcales bacterium]|nr:SIS domain-containing protein [Magnetococcales bacterium]
MNAIENCFLQSSDPARFAQGYCDYLGRLFNQLDYDRIGAFLDALLQARERQARIFFIGNGGSAATASHFANDIAIGSRSRRKPFRAVSLCDNVAMLTALANDFGYDQIFVRQLENQMVAGDMVVALSASGNSANVVRAIEYANAHAAFTVGLTGFDGGQLQRLVHLNVHVPSNPGEYGPVEDVHMILDHLVGAFLMQRVQAEERESAAQASGQRA